MCSSGQVKALDDGRSRRPPCPVARRGRGRHPGARRSGASTGTTATSSSSDRARRPLRPGSSSARGHPRSSGRRRSPVYLLPGPAQPLRLAPHRGEAPIGRLRGPGAVGQVRRGGDCPRRRRPRGRAPPPPAALVAPARAQVDDPVGTGDDVHVVLDDDDRVAGIDQPVQLAHEQLDVGGVQPGGRLVEQVERVAAAARAGARSPA